MAHRSRSLHEFKELVHMGYKKGWHLYLWCFLSLLYTSWFIIGSYRIVIIYSTIQCTCEFSRVLHTIYGRNRSGDPCNGLLYSVRNWVVWPLVSTKEPGSCMLFKCLKYILVYLETRSYSFSNQTINTAVDHKYPHQSRKWREIFGSSPPFKKVSKRCPIASFTVRYSNRARTKPTVLLLSGNSAHLLVLGWIGDMIENDNRK